MWPSEQSLCLPWLRALQVAKDMPTLNRRIISSDMMTLHESIGAGAFGVVYRAALRLPAGGTELVAVKQLSRAADSPDRYTEFLSEAVIMVGFFIFICLWFVR